MGACLSSTASDYSIHQLQSTCAFVIAIKGHLRPYPTPVFVSEVVQIEAPSSSMSSFFVCNSDNLHYDQHIIALDLEHQLEAGHIYFILPKPMLGHRLGASDMAMLAVKASVALNSSANSAGKSRSSSGEKKKKKQGGISATSQTNHVMVEEEGAKNASLGSPAGSIRKMQRYSSSRKGGGFKVGSFKLRLSTIYEIN